jgi:diguanylate cyclase (GGDEF)-like protein
LSHRALIADPNPSSSSQLRHFLESASFQVGVAHALDEAVEVLRKEPVDLLLALASSQFDGESLAKRARQLRPQCSVVLAYDNEEEDEAESRYRAASADAYLVTPLKKGTVVSCARSVMRLRQLAESVGRLEKDLKGHVADPPKDVLRVDGSSADFAFFRRFLLMEVKRSRRYKFPVSFLLVALDSFPEHSRRLKQREKTMLQALVLAAITRGLRDIDLAVPASEGRFLVFLPHTPREGATTVAQRMRARIGKLEPLEGVGVSVGLASYEGGGGRAAVSFGSLMREATQALQRAQKAGGDRVELAGEGAKRPRIVMG